MKVKNAIEFFGKRYGEEYVKEHRDEIIRRVREDVKENVKAFIVPVTSPDGDKFKFLFEVVFHVDTWHIYVYLINETDKSEGVTKAILPWIPYGYFKGIPERDERGSRILTEPPRGMDQVRFGIDIYSYEAVDKADGKKVRMVGVAMMFADKDSKDSIYRGFAVYIEVGYKDDGKRTRFYGKSNKVMRYMIDETIFSTR